MNKPNVAIILINYNALNTTKECVKSILEMDYENYEIIIVDNASEDISSLKSDEYLNGHCHIIYSDTNGGFSYGNNLGIKYALDHNDFDFVLILNNDTTVRKDLLAELIHSAEMHDSAALVTARICHYDDHEKIDYCGANFDRKIGMVNFRKWDKENGSSKRDIKVTFATGALWLLRIKAIQEVGLMDEEYFMYGEDTEYCCRLIDHGYDLCYTDRTEIYHKISESTGGNSPFRQYYIMRNGLYNIKKYGTKPIIGFIYQFLLSIYLIIIGRNHLKPMMDGWTDYLKKRNGRSSKY